MPLIWQIVSDKLDEGERILYHAHSTNTSAYIIGMITKIDDVGVAIKRPGERKATLMLPFSKNDDAFLNLRVSNDLRVSDYTIEDSK